MCLKVSLSTLVFLTVTVACVRPLGGPRGRFTHLQLDMPSEEANVKKKLTLVKWDSHCLDTSGRQVIATL